MGHSVRDLKVYSNIIIDTQPWLADPKVVPIPWRPVELPSKLSFAVIKTNRVVNPLPPVARGLEIATRKLQEAGHEIIDWPLEDQNEVGHLSVFATQHQQAAKDIEQIFYSGWNDSYRVLTSENWGTYS